MKTIIVPTDFSPAAINAANYAADMALAIEANLLLLHVYQVPVSYYEVTTVLVSLDEVKKYRDEEIEKLKKDIEHITSGKIKVNTEVRMGNVVDELSLLSDLIHPFAIVMGTKGHTGLERTLFGSSALTAIKKLHWPIICVPPGKEFGNGIRKIGLACDFKEVVETIPANSIKDLVKEFNGELHVLNVDYDNRQLDNETPEQSALLHSMLEELDPQYHFIKCKDIEEGINDFADQNNLDLVIAIPKKHKILDSLFKKSSTRQLVFESHVPVMCVHD